MWGTVLPLICPPTCKGPCATGQVNTGWVRSRHGLGTQESLSCPPSEDINVAMKVLCLCAALPTQKNYCLGVKACLRQAEDWQDREDFILMVSLYQCDIYACVRALVCVHIYLL